MKKMIHSIYVAAGFILCQICLLWWSLRDVIDPPKTDSVLFVAHPDDDTLFFHQYIKEKKPYVCLMTTGWSMRRLPCFFKAMKYYGVRYRAYPMGARDKRIQLLKKHTDTVLRLASFPVVAVHNAEGEYGHEEHIRVHDAVVEQCRRSGKEHVLYCPAKKFEIANYPLLPEVIQEKKYIFNNIYTTEKWVLDEEAAGTPIWVVNEKLKEFIQNEGNHGS